MKKQEQEETALVIFERNHLILFILLGFSALFALWAWQLLKVVNPIGFLIMVPAAFLAFQCLWLLLNPFGMIYVDKIEIRQSFFHRKARYFVDIKKIWQGKNGKLYITYNDDEVEQINLFGIKNSHKEVLKTEVGKFISASLQTRTAM